MQFAIYDAASAGTLLWQEPAGPGTASILVVNGIFNVRLGGNGVPLPASVFAGGTVRYLAVTANGETLSPRQQIAAAGYAHQAQNAGDAAQLGGVAASQFVQTTDSRLADARAPTGGSPLYIQNGTVPQAAAFNITGSGAVGGAFTSAGAIAAGTGVSGSNPALTFSTTGARLTPDQGGSIELGSSGLVAAPTGAVPYIDFHYGTGTAKDFNVRLINDANGQLTVSGNLRLSGSLNMSGNFATSGNFTLGGTLNGRYPVTANGAMRVLRGQVAANGAIVAGEGFTVNHRTNGLYVIYPAVNFGAAPAVTLSYTQPNIGGTAPVVRIAALWNQPSYNAIGVTTFTTGGVFTDTDFDFIAIGPP